MAAPETASIENLNGRWSMNVAMSDSFDSILRIQGINWRTRKMLRFGTLVLTIRQDIDQNDETRLTIESKNGLGLPSSTENRVVNGSKREATHPLFGKITGRTRWADVTELPSKFLASDWEPGTTRVILFTTEHADLDAVTYQANGMRVVDGVRKYVRHIEVQKAQEVLQAVLVYDYLGPAE